MIKRTLWYAFLVLLCCSIGVAAVLATTPAKKATPVTSSMLTMPKDAVGNPALKAAGSTSNAGGVAEAPRAIVTKPQEANLEAEKAAAWETYERWLLNGSATPAEKELMDRYVFPAMEQRNDNPLDNTGGPDGFGYMFVDNQGGDSATYGWIELCDDPLAINGPTGDDAAQQFTIGWNFPFYGTTYTSFYATTNGLITFGSSNTAYSNNCIVGWNPAQPTIAPYWDDSYAGSQGGCGNTGVGPWIRYRDFGTYAVVSWKMMPHCCPSTDRASFQAILFPNGKIKFQYNPEWSVTANPNSATIGVDAPGTNFGLEYACNASGNVLGSTLTAGRAVWIYPAPAVAHDFACTAITAPGTGNYGPGTTISVIANFTNNGTTTESAPVQYQFNGGAWVTENTPVLAQYGSDLHTFATQITLPALVGDYVLNVRSNLATDQTPANNQQTITVHVRVCADMALGTPTLPYTVAGATCGFVNDHFNTCLGSYDGGEDYIYSWTVATAGNYDIILDPLGTTWPGVAIDDECPPAAACIAYGTTVSGTITLGAVPLTPGTYYIMIDTWPSPDCIPAFNLTLRENVPPQADFTIDAPGQAIGTTCGEMDDCTLRGGEDVLVAVNITDISVSYAFTLCASTPPWDSYLFLTTGACGGTILASNDDSWCGALSTIPCYAFTTPGTYYIDIEPFSNGSCGNFTLDVTACVPCDVECPPDAIPEGEPDVYDEYVDVTNGGCNSDPAVFGTIQCGQTVCGTAGSYLFQGSQYRDTDWYELVLTEPQTVTWTASGEFPILLFIISSPCPGGILASGTADSCMEATVSYTCNPGTYYLWAGPSVFAGIRPDAEYWGSVTCVPYDPPEGRCCYGTDPENPLCEYIEEFPCLELAGEWIEGLTCDTPCPIPPHCPTDAVLSQVVTMPEEAWSGYTSDLGVTPQYQVYDNFEVSQPIGGMRFWGGNAWFDPSMGWVACTTPEPDMPFVVNFFNDNAGQPGDLLATYNVVGTAVPGDLYGGFWTVNQYDVVFDPPVALPMGWVSIQGSGDPGCWLLWWNSNTGDNSALQWNGTSYSILSDNMAFCITPGSCDPVPGVTIYNTTNNAHVWLHFNASSAGDYKIYSTTNKNNDGNPDSGADPAFTLETTITATGPGVVSWTDPAAPVAYKNYVVTRDCSLPEPLGRCCYGDPMSPSCLSNATRAECDALAGMWSYGLSCETDPCPIAELGDECYAPFDIAANTPTDGNNNTATGTDITACAFGDQYDVWYRYMPAVTGTASIDLCLNGTFDTSLAAYDACGGTELACNDDFCGLQSGITVPTTANSPIFIRVAGYGGARGTFTLQVIQ